MENADFLIPLKGLDPNGDFTWLVGKEFFESFGNTEILDASLRADAVARKVGSGVEVDCSVVGNVKVLCDRCLSDLVLPVDVSIALRFGGNDGADADGKVADEDDGDEVSVGEVTEEQVVRERLALSEGESDIDMSQAIYDYVCLALPMKKVHPEGECDAEVVSRLTNDGAGGHGTSETEGAAENSPFGVLKGIFEDKTNNF